MARFRPSDSLGSLILSTAVECPAEMDFVQLGEWLLSFSDQDRDLLRHTREFRDFTDAACRLEQAKQIVKNWNVNEDIAKAKDRSVESKRSFLQYLLSDEALLCVFDFLESHSLVHASATCTRLRDLSYQNARSRCTEIERERQLTNVMQLLRAKEQIEGLGSQSDLYREEGTLVEPASLSTVRIPTLLLSRRVEVSRAGDPDYNGVYFCTGCNGNGYVFTKPRYPSRRVPTTESQTDEAGHQSREISDRSQSLKCIFSKNFSGQTLLWYLSKEIYQAGDEDDSFSGRRVAEHFSFWAPLLTTGSTTPHLNPYPSQSSTLQQGGQQAWRCLDATRLLEPPVVEIVD